jgi:hypothetical protein
MHRRPTHKAPGDPGALHWRVGVTDIPSVSIASSSVCCDRHLAGLETFRPLADVELDRLTFYQCPETVSFDGGIVDEHIFSAVLRDEAKPFQVIEPLHLSALAQRATSYIRDALLNIDLCGARATGDIFSQWASLIRVQA